MMSSEVIPAREIRYREIMLMALALTLGIGGYVLTSYNRTGSIPRELGFYIGILVAIAVVVEAGMHILAPYADPVIMPITVALTGIGLAMIYRLDQSYIKLNMSTFGNKQLIVIGISLVITIFILLIIRNHRLLQRYTYLFGILSVVLLLLPMIPGLGQESFGARVWIRIGPLSLQPGEMAKVTLAIFFACYLVANKDRLAVGGKQIFKIYLPRMKDLTPILVIWLIAIAILVFQRDLGTSLLFFGMFVAMLYVATNRPSWLIIGVALFIPAAIVATKVFPHVQNRFNVWLHALDPSVYEPTDGSFGSYQVVQGLFGQASGGLSGSGWGRGFPQLVVHAESDFILSSLAEELGLTGLLAILVLYVILIERGLRTALTLKDDFGKLLSTGLAFSLGLQVFVVLGGITRVIPLTGLTAPFLASGGSSMIASWVMVALLIRMSDAARRPPRTTPTAVPEDHELQSARRPAYPRSSDQSAPGDPKLRDWGNILFGSTEHRYAPLHDMLW